MYRSGWKSASMETHLWKSSKQVEEREREGGRLTPSCWPGLLPLLQDSAKIPSSSSPPTKQQNELKVNSNEHSHNCTLEGRWRELKRYLWKEVGKRTILKKKKKRRNLSAREQRFGGGGDLYRPKETSQKERERSSTFLKTDLKRPTADDFAGGWIVFSFVFSLPALVMVILTPAYICTPLFSSPFSSPFFFPLVVRSLATATPFFFFFFGKFHFSSISFSCPLSLSLSVQHSGSGGRRWSSGGGAHWSSLSYGATKSFSAALSTESFLPSCMGNTKGEEP